VFFDVQPDGTEWQIVLDGLVVRRSLGHAKAHLAAYLGNVALREGQPDDHVIDAIRTGTIYQQETTA
jgi:hypothetical protein